MRETDTWKTNCFIVGSPEYQIQIPNARRKKQPNEPGIEKRKEGWVLTNKIELSPDRAIELFEFLTFEENALKQIASDEDQEKRETLGKVYSLLAEYGRDRRMMREGIKKEEPPKKKVIPTTLPKGKYFTVPQAVEICNVNVRQIEKWIQMGDLDAVDLPGLGKLIEVGKLNRLYR